MALQLDPPFCRRQRPCVACPHVLDRLHERRAHAAEALEQQCEARSRLRPRHPHLPYAVLVAANTRDARMQVGLELAAIQVPPGPLLVVIVPARTTPRIRGTAKSCACRARRKRPPAGRARRRGLALLARKRAASRPGPRGRRSMAIPSPRSPGTAQRLAWGHRKPPGPCAAKRCLMPPFPSLSPTSTDRRSWAVYAHPKPGRAEFRTALVDPGAGATAS
jgi:hypothetical protein